MSYILDKSKQNRYAALKLYDTEKKYAPSIHCAYYSSIQLMIHVLLENGYTEQKISEDTKKESSHLYYIKETEALLKVKSLGDIKNFSEIKNLKAYRTKSDYRNIEISSDDCDKAIKIADKVNGILNRVFKIQ